MYFKPGFLGPVKAISSSGNLIPIEAIPAVHGGVGQGTQGGSAPVLNPDGSVGTVGQYYHMSAAMYAWLIDLAKNRYWAEPEMTTAGEIMTGLNGDILMGFVAFPNAILPDILAFNAPADPTVDGFWDYVRLRCQFDNVDGSINIVDESKYNSPIGKIGNLSITTAQSKFGGSALLFPTPADYLLVAANGGYLGSNDKAIYDLGAGDFEFSGWIRTTSFFTQQTLLWFGGPGPLPFFAAFINTAGALTGQMATAYGNFGTTVTSAASVGGTKALTLNQKHHFEIGRVDQKFYMFLDGQSTLVGGFAQAAGTILVYPWAVAIGQKMNGAAAIGEGFAPNTILDDIRFTVGKGRHTANFTPPTQAYPIG